MRLRNVGGGEDVNEVELRCGGGRWLSSSRLYVRSFDRGPAVGGCIKVIKINIDSRPKPSGMKGT